MKKILLICFICFLPFFSLTSIFADNNDWTIIPKGSGNKAGTISKKIWNKAWQVWKTYKKESKNISVWNAFASGVFSWDTIFKFLKHIAKVLSEIWLVIWAAMIIYAGYKYASGVFTWDASKWWKDAIKWAIYGILIIIFSYAIMKILLAMFW